jgi:hypothetical protein
MPTRGPRDLGLDCGDNSCLFARSKGGMRTNGGCRCPDNIASKLATLDRYEQLLRSAKHEAGCHPSEGVHTEWCRAVRAALEVRSNG